MKIAVVLLNLGGPDRPEAIKPFLRNLFADKAILGVPWPVRPLLAWLIATIRAPTARQAYRQLGGASPLLFNTQAQATALERVLRPAAGSENSARNYKTFIAMRYWHPLIAATVDRVHDWNPDKVILLPLYPQFSTTTTESGLSEWQRISRKRGLDVPTAKVCCYPTQAGLIRAIAAAIRAAVGGTGDFAGQRVLFSAHGLPQKVIDTGDPYAWQVEQTAAEIVRALAVPQLDWVVCYQSRVGPLQWIGPATADEIERAGAAGLGVVVVPIAFVSEHVETLVELDIEYRALAERAGVRSYRRVATVSVAPDFITGLAALVHTAADRDDQPMGENGRLCPSRFQRCVCRAPA